MTIRSRFVRSFGKLVRFVAFALALVSAGSTAFAQCEVVDDKGLYEARKQEAILLMQYGDAVVRAAGGRIRCEEDQAKGHQACAMTGPGEMLVEAGQSRLIVRVTSADDHVVHVTQSGEATCQP